MFIELINLRGYTIIDINRKIVLNPMKNEKIQFFVVLDDKLDMSFFYNKKLEIESDVKHIIFIYKIATVQMKKLKTCKDILRIELFYENELSRLLCGNRLIPKHIRLSQEKQNEVVEKIGMGNLPLILSSDPIVKLYDFDVNSVIMIQRKYGIYYRLVVNDD